MKPFDQLARCPKCHMGDARQGTIGTRYVAEDAPTETVEHMVRTCTFCAYSWNEQLPAAPVTE